MLIIDSEEKLNELDIFLGSNILYSVGTNIIDSNSYFEVKSIKPETLLIDKKILNYEIFFKIMNRFIESRNMLLDQDFKKLNCYNIKTEQGGAKIETEYCKCNLTLFTSITDDNTLVPSDRDFLMNLLSMVDNGSEPIIIAKNNEEFYLALGNNLTIKFDRKLLKYIEEFTYSCKHNQEYLIKLERKKENGE